LTFHYILGDGSPDGCSGVRPAQRLTAAGCWQLSMSAVSGVFPQLKLVNFTSLDINAPNWK